MISAVVGSAQTSRTMTVRNGTIAYDPRDGVSYCSIAKAASSTWARHFASLANPPNYQLAQWANAIQVLAVRLWPLPEKATPKKVRGGTTVLQ